MMIQFYDIVGFAGSLCIILAYFLLQADILSSEGLPYSVINLLGAFMLLYSLFFAWNISVVFIEVVWIGISIFGIVKWYKKRHATTIDG